MQGGGNCRAAEIARRPKLQGGRNYKAAEIAGQQKLQGGRNYRAAKLQNRSTGKEQKEKTAEPEKIRIGKNKGNTEGIQRKIERELTFHP